MDDRIKYPLYQVLAALHGSPAILATREPERDLGKLWENLRTIDYAMKGTVMGPDRNWNGLDSELKQVFQKSHRTAALAGERMPEEASGKNFTAGNDPKRIELLTQWVDELETKYGKEVTIPNFSLKREGVKGWSFSH